MADFVAVIRKAVDNLQDNTLENRAKVYDKARAAIRRQLEAMNPRPSDEAIQRQLAKLETAIRDVDAEHAEALPPDADETEALMAELESMVGRSPAVSEDSSYRQAVEPPPPPQPRSENPAPAPVVQPAAAYAVAAAPKTAPPPGERPPVLTGADHDEAFGLGDAPPKQRGKPAAARAPRQSRKAGRGGIIALVLLLLAGGAAVAAWANRDSLEAMLNTDPTPAPVAEATVEPETEPAPETAAPQQQETAAVAPETGTAPDTGTGPEDTKFTQRLNADGTETDPGPAPAPEEPLPVEGRSLAGRDEAPEVAAAANEQPVDEDAAETATADSPVTGDEATAPEEAPAAPEETAAAPSQPLGVQQKMYLYEERLDQQTPDAFNGSVVWTLVREPGTTGAEEPVIRGEINNPDKGLSALMTIRRNTDASLPASHIIEVVFALPEGFEGGGVDQLQRINMKETEQANGNPLIAVPAQITQDFYMVALNDLPEAVTFNTDLLRQRNWIDIPIVYANGRRGLITLEKGSSGVGVFNDALDEWARLSGSN